VLTENSFFLGSGFLLKALHKKVAQKRKFSGSCGNRN